MKRSSIWLSRGAWRLVGLLSCPGGLALAAAGPGTVDCRAALEGLQRIEAEALAARAAQPAASGAVPQRVLEQVRAVRRDAAKACLGGSGDAPPPTASTQPPVSVAPLRREDPPSATPVPRAPAPVVTIPRPAPPVVVTNCDPQGCWASDGSRLSRFGSSLLGPRGMCSVQGALLVCP